MCTYCLKNPSTKTGDHIFARAFFPESERTNLPKVPACKQCNDEKSQLEHYLTTVLPFGARHRYALSNLKKVESRLAKNKKLHRELATGMQNTSQQLSIPIDSKKILALFKYIARGLICYHWNIHLNSNYDIKVIFATKEIEQFFSRYLHENLKSQQIKNNLGDETFSYQSVQGTDYPEFTLWKFQMLGGATLADHQTTSRSLFALTARISFFQKLSIKDLFN